MVTNLGKLKKAYTPEGKIVREKIQQLGTNVYGYETRDQTTGIDGQQFQKRLGTGQREAATAKAGNAAGLPAVALA